LELDGISANQAHDNAAHWAKIAAGGVGYDDITSGEDSSLVAVAEHLRIKGAVVYLGSHESGQLAVQAKSARLFCAEALAKEWGFASQWLEEVESGAVWADQEAQRAVSAAEDGNWDGASLHASQACAIASEYRHSGIWDNLGKTIARVAK